MTFVIVVGKCSHKSHVPNNRSRWSSRIIKISSRIYGLTFHPSFKQEIGPSYGFYEVESRGFGLYEPLEHVHGGVEVTFTIIVDYMLFNNTFQTTAQDGHQESSRCHRESMACLFLHHLSSR